LYEVYCNNNNRQLECLSSEEVRFVVPEVSALRAL